MFSKTKVLYNIKYFSTSLKQKKENLIKDKKLEKAISNNLNKINETEFEAFMSKFNFQKTINKLSIFFVIAPCAFYFLAQNVYPLYSKELTDTYNTCLNFVVMSNALYVKALFIILDWNVFRI